MLHGVKVLSFTHYLQGPSCVQTLADLGAEVVKIEPHRGAHERHWSGCDTFKNGVSVFFLIGNRNQRSMTINLKAPEGRKIIYDLLKEYDVVVENFRPGVMNKLGFSYEELSAINPRLIYCSCSGYGPSGPYLNKAGQDLLIQGITGLSALNGNDADLPQPMGATVVDQHGATLAALGVLAALYDREKTGKGHRVDSSLLNAALNLQLEPLGFFVNGGKFIPRSHGISTRYHDAPYGVYRTKDGRITISTNAQATLEKMFEPGALAMFSGKDQCHRRLEFDKVVAEQMLKRTTAEWMEICEKNAVWYAPANEYEDVVKDPQVLHNEVFITAEHPQAGEITLINHPVRYDGKPLPLRRLPPALGEHSEEVLREIGYGDDAIRSLLDGNVITTGKKEE